MKNSFLAFVTFILTAMTGIAQPVSINSKVMKPVWELNDAGWQWKMISSRIGVATNKVELLPKDCLRADTALYQIQLSESNPLGAVIFNSGGILVDDGWIRILGSGCERLDRSVPQWNKGKSFADYGDPASYLLVADDALGGLFAINLGGLDDDNIDRMYYYGPCSLTWSSLGISYSQFLSFCFSGDIKKFYEQLHWTGCETDVKQLSTNEVISCYPLIWTRKGNELMHCDRKVVSIEKQWSMYQGEAKPEASKAQKSKAAVKGKTK